MIFEGDIAGGGVCRRFLCSIGGFCRVEYGVCGSVSCGPCFQLLGYWTAGVPFTPLDVQAVWVCEFIKGIRGT